MFLMISLAFTIFLLTFLLMNVMILFSKKSFNKMEKSTPFECGFNSFNNARMTFSLNFFLISIIFIIFDVEIALILPILPTIMFSNITNWFLTSSFFIIIIIGGVLIEWKENSLEWKS